ncbi:MAG: hypothetical protein Salg2KO_03510 [Salibacteraceae bacterium]
MEVTVEISMYPLREDYEPAIIEFINKIKSVDGVTVKVNPTATHFFGDYDLVMETLQKTIKYSFEKYDKVVFAMKVLHGDLEKSLEGKAL